MNLQPVKQDRFGNGPAPEETGNCFPACLASLMGRQLDEVPHFYAEHSDPDAAHAAITAWLHSQGWTLMAWGWSEMMASDYFRSLVGNGVFIASGVSPRGFQHAVIARMKAGGWELVHDPHPSGAGIVGEPTMFELVFPLVLA